MANGNEIINDQVTAPAGSNKNGTGRIHKKHKESQGDIGPKKPSAFSKFIKKHPKTSIIIVAIIALAVVYFVKDIQASIETKALIRKANAEMIESQKASLKLFSRPLAWSIRTELLRGGNDQVDLLINDVVKEKGLEFLHLLGNDGKVTFTTNRKLIGGELDLSTAAGYLGSDTTTVYMENDSLIVLVAPVMGYDSRLGSLVIGFKPTLRDLKLSK